MPKKPDNTSSAMMEAKETRSGGAPVAWMLAIVLLALIIAGGMFLWFNILGARDSAIAFLQKIDPQTRVQEVWIDNQYALLSDRETKIDAREREVSSREKEQDAAQLSLERREKAFQALQEDPNSPIYQNAIYLGSLYANMEPQRAAELLIAVDDIDQINRILRTMPDESVTTILGLLPDDTAAEITLAILGKSSY